MKKTFILFFVIFVIISAQDNPQIIRANYFEAKSGHSAKLEKGLKQLSNELYIIGESTNRVPNTTNVIVPGLEGETAVMSLDMAGFCVSTGSACSSGRVEPSRVILAHGIPADEALCALRISLGWQTTEAEVDAFLAAFGEMLGRMQKAS